MKLPVLLPVASLLVLASACGQGPEPGEVPATCAYAGTVYEPGEEYDSIDGCITYVCEGGANQIVADERRTVEGDLELGSQEDVDAQACLGEVTGSLLITDRVSDLTPLRSLHRVGRDLSITITSLTTLEGLGALGEIAGGLTIADNPELSQLSFLPTMSVFGDLTIQNNDALTSLAGAEFIGQCTSCMPRAGDMPDEGEGGMGLDAEPAGDGGADVGPVQGTYYGAILIADNDVLADIWAMSNLWYAWSDVRFRNNAALTTLSGLQLSEVQGDLEVTDHAAMPTADADDFVAGVDVWGTTTVCGNRGGESCP